MRRTAISFVVVAVLVFTQCQCGRQEKQLRSAAASGDLDQVKRLLEAGADINKADMLGQTALHLAAQAGQMEAVELLIEKNADVNAKDTYGATPLDYAKSKNQTDVVNFLRKHGGQSAKELR